MKQNKSKNKQFFLHGVGRTALTKVILFSSIITIFISIIILFYKPPKLVVFVFILILIIQPLIIVFVNDHNKYK